MRFLKLIFFVLLFVGCKYNVSTDSDSGEVEEILGRLVEEAVYDSYGKVPGVSLTVIDSELGIHWSGTAGYDSKQRDNPLTKEQPFRIASVTKTFVAAAILKLYEEGELSLDDPVSKFISSEHKKLLVDYGYQPENIQIRHILNHSSGLFDYALGGRSYLEAVANDPRRKWTRTEQLEMAMKTGQPVGEPGELFSYSDIGYILAGEIIENITDTTLAWGLRNLLKFDSLKLNSTWLESMEENPNPEISSVHRYAGEYEFTDADPSIDLYGGGGLVSTTDDLANFMHALFNGAVFDNPATIERMLERPDLAIYRDSIEYRPKLDYRIGLWEVEMYGVRMYMHDGFWGVAMVYIPEYECSVSVNYTHGYNIRLLKKTILLIKNLHQQYRNDNS